MKRLMMLIMTLVVGAAAGMTPEEFQALYSARKKGADECWQLYEAYAQGDGVEKNDTQARKWLLAAHRCGKEGAREELAKLPWRSALKVKKSIKVAKVDDATARAKGEELVRLLMAWGKENNVNGINGTACELSKEMMKEVRQLISDGADLNVVVVKDDVYYTALSMACACANADLAKMLIAAGADPCAGGMEALSVCMVRYDEMSPRVKAGQQIKPARTVKGAERTMKRERKKAAAKAPATAVTDSEKNAKKMIELLLKNGLDAGMWTDCGWSVGVMAVFADSPLAIELLAKSGVNVNAPSRVEECVSAAISARRMDYLTKSFFVHEGAVPLYSAVRNMNDAVTQALLNSGADLSAPLNKKGLTVKQFVEEQEKALSEKKGGAPHMLDRWANCIRMLKEAM